MVQCPQRTWDGGNSTVTTKCRGEYDNYTLPELLKEETPESRAERQEALKELDDLIKNRHIFVGNTKKTQN